MLPAPILELVEHQVDLIRYLWRWNRCTNKSNLRVKQSGCHDLGFWGFNFLFYVQCLSPCVIFYLPLPLLVSCVQLWSSPWTEARVCFVCLFCSCVSLLFLHPPVTVVCTLICFWVVLSYLLNNFFPDVCCPFLSNLTPGIWTTGPNRLGMNTP